MLKTISPLVFSGWLAANLMGENRVVLFTQCQVYGHPGANAILCEDGRLKAIGRQEEFQAPLNIDLKGGIVYPGFTDAHLHLLGLGWTMEILDLVGTRSAEEVLRRVSETAAEMKPGQWIQGRGWDQNDWPQQEFPSKELLDEVAPDNPVYLRRIDGHAAWVSSKTLELAGIASHSPDPVGGRILRDERGNPTGILVDNALGLVKPFIPKPSHEDKRRQLLKSIRYLNSLGITSVHDAGTNGETIQILRELLDEGHLSLRVYAMLDDDPDDYGPFLETGPDTSSSFLSIRAVKLYMDGALGSRGAALLEPYSDDPQNRGLILTDIQDVKQRIQLFNNKGFQVCIHCIGDRANRIALDLFSSPDQSSRAPYRNRIEHAQVIHENDLSRFAALGVIPSMQTTHCTSDMYWADERLGERRLKGAYAWQSLIRTGVIIPGGSDAPVESPDPLLGIYAALTRQDLKGWPSGGWQPQERLALEQALKMVTEWPAYAAFEEQKKGKLESGYYADFTVLSQDLETLEPAQIPDVQVLFTIVGGKVVFSR